MNKAICDNLEQIQARIRKACERAGRDPAGVMLVAVSKTRTPQEILHAYECGQTHFGENRVAELQGKLQQIRREDIVWHFVGTMQTNKIKNLVDRVDWIQSVYKLKYLDEIEKRAAAAGRVVNTLIQVNISGEDQKQGCTPQNVPGMLLHAQSLEHVRVRGLMGMATFTSDTGKIRSEFRLLKKTFEENLRHSGGSVELEHISMGMTNDLDIAIEEGSTMVRIGTAIFGERNY